MAGNRDAVPTVSVVVPTRNEARNIGGVLARLPDRVDEVILVDGGSMDGTVAAARAVRPDIRVVQQGRTGKGNALAAGFAAATGDYIVMIDADGSMDPAEMPRFLGALDQGAEYVKGSRFLAGGGSSDITALRWCGNHLLLALANTLFRSRFTDLCYGYNAFRRDCLSAFPLLFQKAESRLPQWGDGFEIETILNTQAVKAGLVIREVPSFEAARRFGESNLRTFRDGSRVLAAILRERASTAQSPVRVPAPRRSGTTAQASGASAGGASASGFRLSARVLPNRSVALERANGAALAGVQRANGAALAGVDAADGAAR